MSEDKQTSKDFTRLPGEWIDGLVKPFVHFLDIEAAGGVVLLLFTVAALVLSNSPWTDTFFNVWETRVGLSIESFEFARSLKDWINDALMTP